MTQNFKQIVYKNDSADINNPSGLTTAALTQGTVFQDYTPMTQLGIQAPPGTKFYINGNNNPVIVGFTGLFSIDFSSTGGIINSLSFDSQSISNIRGNDSAILIVDIAYLGGN